MIPSRRVLIELGKKAVASQRPNVLNPTTVAPALREALKHQSQSYPLIPAPAPVTPSHTFSFRDLVSKDSAFSAVESTSISKDTLFGHVSDRNVWQKGFQTALWDMAKPEGAPPEGFLDEQLNFEGTDGDVNQLKVFSDRFNQIKEGLKGHEDFKGIFSSLDRLMGLISKYAEYDPSINDYAGEIIFPILRAASDFSSKKEFCVVCETVIGICFEHINKESIPLNVKIGILQKGLGHISEFIALEDQERVQEFVMKMGLIELMNFYKIPQHEQKECVDAWKDISFKDLKHVLNRMTHPLVVFENPVVDLKKQLFGSGVDSIFPPTLLENMLPKAIKEVLLVDKITEFLEVPENNSLETFNLFKNEDLLKYIADPQKKCLCEKASEPLMVQAQEVKDKIKEINSHEEWVAFIADVSPLIENIYAVNEVGLLDAHITPPLSALGNKPSLVAPSLIENLQGLNEYFHEKGLIGISDRILEIKLIAEAQKELSVDSLMEIGASLRSINENKEKSLKILTDIQITDWGFSSFLSMTNNFYEKETKGLEQKLQSLIEREVEKIRESEVSLTQKIMQARNLISEVSLGVPDRYLKIQKINTFQKELIDAKEALDDNVDKIKSEPDLKRSFDLLNALSESSSYEIDVIKSTIEHLMIKASEEDIATLDLSGLKEKKRSLEELKVQVQGISDDLGMSGINIADLDRKIGNINEKMTLLAAAKIQRVGRGYGARKQVNKLKGQLEESVESLHAQLNEMMPQEIQEQIESITAIQEQIKVLGGAVEDLSKLRERAATRIQEIKELEARIEATVTDLGKDKIVDQVQDNKIFPKVLSANIAAINKRVDQHNVSLIDAEASNKIGDGESLKQLHRYLSSRPISSHKSAVDVVTAVIRPIGGLAKVVQFSDLTKKMNALNDVEGKDLCPKLADKVDTLLKARAIELLETYRTSNDIKKNQEAIEGFNKASGKRVIVWESKLKSFELQEKRAAIESQLKQSVEQIGSGPQQDFKRFKEYVNRIKEDLEQYKKIKKKYRTEKANEYLSAYKKEYEKLGKDVSQISQSLKILKELRAEIGEKPGVEWLMHIAQKVPAITMHKGFGKTNRVLLLNTITLKANQLIAHATREDIATLDLSGLKEKKRSLEELKVQVQGISDDLGMSGINIADLDRKIGNINEKMTLLAAAKIQRVGRGYGARKQVNKLKGQLEESVESLHAQLNEMMPKKIQEEIEGITAIQEQIQRLGGEVEALPDLLVLKEEIKAVDAVLEQLNGFEKSIESAEDISVLMVVFEEIERIDISIGSQKVSEEAIKGAKKDLLKKIQLRTGGFIKDALEEDITTLDLSDLKEKQHSLEELKVQIQRLNTALVGDDKIDIKALEKKEAQGALAILVADLKDYVGTRFTKGVSEKTSEIITFLDDNRSALKEEDTEKLLGHLIEVLPDKRATLQISEKDFLENLKVVKSTLSLSQEHQSILGEKIKNVSDRIEEVASHKKDEVIHQALEDLNSVEDFLTLSKRMGSLNSAGKKDDFILRDAKDKVYQRAEKLLESIDTLGHFQEQKNGIGAWNLQMIQAGFKIINLERMEGGLTSQFVRQELNRQADGFMQQFENIVREQPLRDIQASLSAISIPNKKYFNQHVLPIRAAMIRDVNASNEINNPLPVLGDQSLQTLSDLMSGCVSDKEKVSGFKSKALKDKMMAVVDNRVDEIHRAVITKLRDLSEIKIEQTGNVGNLKAQVATLENASRMLPGYLGFLEKGFSDKFDLKQVETLDGTIKNKKDKGTQLESNISRIQKICRNLMKQDVGVNPKVMSKSLNSVNKLINGANYFVLRREEEELKNYRTCLETMQDCLQGLDGAHLPSLRERVDRLNKMEIPPQATKVLKSSVDKILRKIIDRANKLIAARADADITELELSGLIIKRHSLEEFNREVQTLGDVLKTKGIKAKSLVEKMGTISEKMTSLEASAVEGQSIRRESSSTKRPTLLKQARNMTVGGSTMSIGREKPHEQADTKMKEEVGSKSIFPEDMLILEKHWLNKDVSSPERKVFEAEDVLTRPVSSRSFLESGHFGSQRDLIQIVNQYSKRSGVDIKKSDVLDALVHTLKNAHLSEKKDEIISKINKINEVIKLPQLDDYTCQYNQYGQITNLSATSKLSKEKAEKMVKDYINLHYEGPVYVNVTCEAEFEGAKAAIKETPHKQVVIRFNGQEHTFSKGQEIKERGDSPCNRRSI